MDQYTQQNDAEIHDDDAAAAAATAAPRQPLLTRIGRWFKRSHDAGDLPLMRETHGGDDDQSSGGTHVVTRSTFLRPWARQEQMIGQLQEGFTTLTDLMRSIRDNLQAQNERQQRLVETLAELPDALQSLPEQNRVQGETLKAIHQTIEYQNLQQEKLTEILGRISDTGGDQRKMLDGLRDQIDAINEYEQAISANLSSIGAAMQGVGRNSQTSAEVLQQLRDNLGHRDAELERVLQKQGTRFTTLLAVAIFLSVVALVAVAVIGYLGYEAITRIQ